MEVSLTTFTPHPDAEQRKRSATALIKLLLRVEMEEVMPKHIEELIDKMLWKITEANGKYNTQYRSERALDCGDTKLLAHEHVYPKKAMIKRLRHAKSEAEVDDILRSAVGCTVMRDEHKLLHGRERKEGWDRYRDAHIAVMDLESGRRVI